MSEDYEPICCSCTNCRRIVKVTRTRYDLECTANPNLGGVTRSYGKCRSYLGIVGKIAYKSGDNRTENLDL